MTEQNLPDDDLEVVQDDDVLLDEAPGAASSLELDPVKGEPDSYPGAAENNPDRWQEDPLLQDEAVSGEEEDFLSDQAFRDASPQARQEAGGPQDAPLTPTLGEAVADVDFGENPTGPEAEGSDDTENFGGSPLSEFDPDDLER
ncbi:hypothetical protein [Pseudarthrobacter sp. NamB4]|uniref:hypothetical protein n=1 Tax=Pseudarthrobacter sp. NamB4 TaxID=2576837 RepID=UPI0010FDADBE|nr:hypothetical protein [Pseudarthrobacter sp. NamB4]TLM73586.1 hypothetical protein FDW81_09060 [Pseudarthrobacter sp. NamB4]